MRGPLVVLAANTKEHAAVWFARRTELLHRGQGATGETLRERAYFQRYWQVAMSSARWSSASPPETFADHRVAGPRGSKVAGAVGVSIDAAKLAASVDQQFAFGGRDLLCTQPAGADRAAPCGRADFVFPSDVGSVTLSDAVKNHFIAARGVCSISTR